MSVGENPNKKEIYFKGLYILETICPMSKQLLLLQPMVDKGKQKSNIQGEPKYRVKKGNEQSDIERFKNRTSLPEI